MRKVNVSEKECILPDTVFVRDVEGEVFQSIVVKCLSEIQDIALSGGNLIDHLLGREGVIKGVMIEQDEKNQSVGIKIEIHIAYGVSIPDKAAEIQSKVTETITNLTGLHVSSVHVIFKGLIAMPKEIIEQQEEEEDLFPTLN
ncbi:MAG: Asp23/Gls24 family envelope stress response protein [Simkaniaceae bacterium]|nr:Asp23/Gls24 family envelope stress response protein [Simkaniaceae bacterium]